MARCKLQAKKSKFRDATNTEEQFIELVITRTKHPELQKQLSAKGLELTPLEALNICRVHKVSISHMKKLAKIQDGKCQEINRIATVSDVQHKAIL